MADRLIDQVDHLLASARPGGTPHKRLIKFREQLVNHVFLGPSALRYIRVLWEDLEDRIECRHLMTRGKCRKLNRVCNHQDGNKACDYYEPARPQTAGNPLGPLGRLQ